MHLVNWKIICSPIPRGGLGIENIMLFNKALVGKWLWRFGQEENSLWRWVTVMKYGIQRGGWCLKEAWGPYGVSTWWNIRNGSGSFSNSAS
jgi:hypothetical protein